MRELSKGNDTLILGDNAGKKEAETESSGPSSSSSHRRPPPLVVCCNIAEVSANLIGCPVFSIPSTNERLQSNRIPPREGHNGRVCSRPGRKQLTELSVHSKW